MEKLKILISGNLLFIRTIFVRDGEVEYFFIEKTTSENFVGNIYKGKIEKIVRGLNAAFVNIGEPVNGFLHFDQEEIYFEDENFTDVNFEKRPHSTGEEILVQVTKPGKELKGMKLTTRITLPGKYLVLIPKSQIRTISRKIKDKTERKRLLNIMKKYIPSADGFIVRTYAEGKNERLIGREIKFLLKEWRRIEKAARVSASPSLLWKELPLHTRVMRDFLDKGVEEILVEGGRFYNEVKKYLRFCCPENLKVLRFYSESVPLFERFNLNSKIMRFLDEKVYLPSGGYLIIEEGKTLTAIDVNTGSFESDNYSRTIYNTNMEAAKEIPRQIRVRNLSGLIIIDFIDMREEKKKRNIFEEFKRNLEYEKVRIKLLSLSELGLVEMSRERSGISLREFFYEECKGCSGAGKVKNLNFVIMELEKEINKLIFRTKTGRIKIRVVPELFELIFRNELFIPLIKKKKIEIEAGSLPEGRFFIIETN